MTRCHLAIDLFSGAGGFSLGMERAGFQVIGAVDSSKHAVAVYRENLGSNIIESDIRSLPPEEFSRRTGIDEIDVIFGGPPCQGFSTANTRNHGSEFLEDKRRYLYRDFLKYVRAFNPKIFVMENVRGIKKAAGGKLFGKILEEARKEGYWVHQEELYAWHYGIPQKRIRHIIVGIRKDIPFEASDKKWVEPTHSDPDGEGCGLHRPVTLWEAICDLPCLKAGESADRYDLARRKRMLGRYPGGYIEKVAQVRRMKGLTGHSARMHSERDLRDFALLKEGQSSATALRNGVKMEFPYCRDTFKDRYTRQHRNRLSSTILAHLSKDGLMFIHPTQERSITPREAARIQSFPDNFVFSCSRTHQFQLIGNAVPPLMAEAIGKAVMKQLQKAKRRGDSVSLSAVA